MESLYVVVSSDVVVIVDGGCAIILSLINIDIVCVLVIAIISIIIIVIDVGFSCVSSSLCDETSIRSPLSLK